MLGVGMVFGVLLLVGTIHPTFDRLYDSIYGKTDIVVSRRSVGQFATGRRSTIAPASGVDARPRAASTACSGPSTPPVTSSGDRWIRSSSPGSTTPSRR